MAIPIATGGKKMPIKLIGILILVVAVALLTGFNLNNKCNIWLFHDFKDIPVFGALLASFILGVLITLPFTFGKTKVVEKEVEKAPKEKKSGLFGKLRNKSKSSEAAETSEIQEASSEESNS